MNVLDLKDRAVKHTNEAIWWNKGLTKINRENISNYDEFINNLIQVKGPYLERVEPPKFSTLSWSEYCSKNEIPTSIETAVAEVVFGNKEGRLYKHQAEAIDSILTSIQGETEKDTIITVPTATGKTECFLLPSLLVALRNREEDEYPRDIKSLIIYPQKALETDQLDRIVRYAYYINKEKRSKESLKIGIYDGDTPRGKFEISDGENIRGLKCPVCEEKLKWDSDSGCLFCSNTDVHDRPVEIDFLELTRNEIEENGADIMITNPEALEFRFFSSDARELIDSDKLDLVVFDETHEWQGNGGKAVSLLTSRLRKIYDPTFVLSSATIANPKDFSCEILSRTAEKINHIDFRAGEIISPEEKNIPKLNILPPNKAFALLEEIKESSNVEKFKSNSDIPDERIEDTQDFLKTIGYLGKNNGLTEDGEGILSELKKRNAIEENNCRSVFDRSIGLRRDLSERLMKNLPHISKIFEQFGERDFVSVEKLLEELFPGSEKENSFTEFNNLIKWCKLVGILYDRYHYFLKPYINFYYCSKCNGLFTERVSQCSEGEVHSLHPVKFCPHCHTPYYEEGDEIFPIKKACSCTSRGNYIQPRMKTTTFLSYFLSRLGRDLKRFGEGKVLVFSNRRGDAEGVGSLMINLDYSLASERLIISLLNKNSADGFYSVKDLQEDLYEKLKDVYAKTPYGYLEDEVLSQGLFSQLGSISNPLNKENHRKIFDSGILSIKPVSEKEEINFLANEIVKVLAFKPHRDLNQKHSIKKKSLEEKLSNSVPIYSSSTPNLEGRIEKALSALEENNVVKVQKERDSDEILDILTLRRNFLQLLVQEEIKFCDFCLSGWPFWNKSHCPDCGNSLNEIQRETDANFEDQLLINEENGLDHWGKLIVEEEFNPLISAVHKAGIKTSTRNKIEESFRVTPPRINVVSATNTLELGIDIGTLDCIVGLGIPPSKTSYTQRAGRAGRNLDRSSVVFTVARPHNAVDNFYFEDIEGRFLNADPKPARINQLSYDILKTQIMSEILAYLNRNKLNYTDYERFDTKKDIEEVIKEVYDGISNLVETVKENRREIKEHIYEVFSEEKEEEIKQALSELFDEESEIEYKVLRRLHIFYSLFRTLEEESGKGVKGMRRRRVIQEEILGELEKEVSYLPMLLSQVGLVSQYRSRDEKAVLFREEEGDEGKTHLSYESKNISQALRESYPEAIDSYAGVDYEVISTQVGQNPLFVTNICMNEACILPYNEYPLDLEECPLCGDELEKVNVHKYLGSILRFSKSRKRTRSFPIRGVSIEGE